MSFEFFVAVSNVFPSHVKLWFSLLLCSSVLQPLAKCQLFTITAAPIDIRIWLVLLWSYFTVKYILIGSLFSIYPYWLVSCIESFNIDCFGSTMTSYFSDINNTKFCTVTVDKQNNVNYYSELLYYSSPKWRGYTVLGCQGAK